MTLTSPTPSPEGSVCITETLLCAQVSQNPVCADESILYAQVIRRPILNGLTFRVLTTVAGLHPLPVAAWLLNIPIRCHRWFVRSPFSYTFSYLFPLIITMLFPLDPSVTTYHLLDGTMDCFPMMIDDN